MRAVQPAIPKIVVITLDLYLNIFLIVILSENLSFFQIKLIRSNKIFLPLFGAFGLIRLAGTSLKFLIQTITEVPHMHKIHIQSPKAL